MSRELNQFTRNRNRYDDLSDEEIERQLNEARSRHGITRNLNQIREDATPSIVNLANRIENDDGSMSVEEFLQELARINDENDRRREIEAQEELERTRREREIYMIEVERARQEREIYMREVELARQERERNMIEHRQMMDRIIRERENFSRILQEMENNGNIFINYDIEDNYYSDEDI